MKTKMIFGVLGCLVLVSGCAVKKQDAVESTSVKAPAPAPSTDPLVPTSPVVTERNPILPATWSCKGTLFNKGNVDNARNDGQEILVGTQPNDFQHEELLYENSAYRVVFSSHMHQVSLAARRKDATHSQVGYSSVTKEANTLHFSANDEKTFTWVVCNKKQQPSEVVLPLPTPMPSSAPGTGELPEQHKYKCLGTLFAPGGVDVAAGTNKDIEVVALPSDNNKSTVLLENSKYRVTFTSHKGQVSVATKRKTGDDLAGYALTDLKSSSVHLSATRADMFSWMVCIKE